jgi:putative heme-binding domain-containing protein
LEAAEALGKSQLDESQLKALAEAVATSGVLEVPKLLPAFEHSASAAVGEALVSALGRSSGLRSVQSAALQTTLQSYPESVRQQAEPLFQQLTVDTAKQKARLAELQDVLTGGDIQRGRDLFFGNKKAICATCHAVQGQGGKFGPDLSKIGAIRTPRDLIEALVFPSASFARGYEPFSIVTDSGQTLSGIISRETAESIFLVNAARVETRVARSAIESLQQSTVSIMPEGMDAQLSHQELGDLIAFLQSLR